MTNTVLCGSVSYNRIVFRKKENSEVEANADFYFDFCGSERKIPIREFASTTVQFLIDENTGGVLEDFLKLSPEQKNQIKNKVEDIFLKSKYKDHYKNLPNVKNESETIELAKKAIYDEVVRELANRKIEKIFT